MGGGEHLLDGVLGLVRAPEHVAAEGEQRGGVAVEHDLERHLVAGLQPRDQRVVAAQGEEPLGQARPGGL